MAAVCCPKQAPACKRARVGSVQERGWRIWCPVDAVGEMKRDRDKIAYQAIAAHAIVRATALV